MKIGDKVIKNPQTWVASEFDVWGSGEGVGEIIGFDGPVDDLFIDVRWEGGCSFHMPEELLLFK